MAIFRAFRLGERVDASDRFEGSFDPNRQIAV